MAARDVDPYLDTLYSAFEMLESGITTVQHLHGVRLGPAARVIGAAERVLKAYDDIGMRVSYSYALRDQNRLAYEADEAFARRFPAPVSGELAAYLRGPGHSRSRITTGSSPISGRSAAGTRAIEPASSSRPPTCTGARTRRSKRSATGRPRTRWACTCTWWRRPTRRSTRGDGPGARALQHLAKLGLVGPQLTLGHGVWLTEADIDSGRRPAP